MKIVKIEDLHCDAGWRVNSFLKITSDEGIVGWSEYMEGYGAQGLTGVIQKLAERFLIGRDPRPVEAISALLYAATRQAAGGINQMAIASHSIGRTAAPIAPAMPTRSRNGPGSSRCDPWTTSSRSARK